MLKFTEARGIEQLGTFVLLSTYAYNIVHYGGKADIQVTLMNGSITLLNGSIRVKPYRGSFNVFVEILDEKVVDVQIVDALNTWFFNCLDEVLRGGDQNVVAKRLQCTKLEAMYLIQYKSQLPSLAEFVATNDVSDIFGRSRGMTIGSLHPMLFGRDEPTPRPDQSFAPFTTALLAEQSHMLSSTYFSALHDKSSPAWNRYQEVLQKLEDLQKANNY
jgi:hypothetical protein